MTLIVFCFGLQTWFPLWLLSSWFMYYTWFNGVYYFIVLVFPFMHNALVRVKGESKAVLRWFIVYCVGTLITAGLLGLYYALPAWEEHDDVAKAKSWKENAQNIYALSTMMFPPYWVPCVGTGMAAYFWYDAVRPAESHKRALYGHCADVLTLAFFAFHLAHFFDIDWPYPTNVTGKMWEVVAEEHHRWDTGIKRYVWSVMITRLYSPLIAVWIALLSIPKGSRTTRLLESNLLSKVLAPTSYGCFLFHQIIGQWYWWATRNGNGIATPDVGDQTSWMLVGVSEGILLVLAAAVTRGVVRVLLHRRIGDVLFGGGRQVAQRSTDGAMDQVYNLLPEYYMAEFGEERGDFGWQRRSRRLKTR